LPWGCLTIPGGKAPSAAWLAAQHRFTPNRPQLHRPETRQTPGEHIDQFEIFETRRFVSRLLGRGDVGGLMDKIQDVIPEVRLLS
jgi:hypothetical protein